MDAKKIFSLVLSLIFIQLISGCTSDNQSASRDLQTKLEELTKDFQGEAGIFVMHLSNGVTAEINADNIFPTASMIKVPILITMFDKFNKGELSEDSVLIYHPDTINYKWKGDDAVSRFKEGEDISIRKLMALMITFSDNHASLWLQKLAGGGTAINDLMKKLGYQNTRVNSRTQGREEPYQEFGWGQTSPREMADLLLKIRQGKLISRTASESMYRFLTRIYWDGEALSQIPPTIQSASKQGAVDQSRSEVVLVNAPHGDYVFCVITKDQQDESWVESNEGFVLIKKVSDLLWNYFEPDFGWESNRHK